MSWIFDAVCHKDRHKKRWTSFNLEDIEYAKEGCKKCPVIKNCMKALSKDGDIGVGVMFGLSNLTESLFP